jgi:hypothetical protein
MTACNAGGQEQACGLLEDLPPRTAQTSVDQLEEVAEAARESETAKIRKIGQQLSLNLGRTRLFESLAPGSAVEIVDANLEDLRQACRDLEEAAAAEGGSI